jgi:S-formylglutathione hydrolase FrmB
VSEKVGVNLPLNVILPDDLARGGKPLEERKVLYLLHGLSDDASAWQRYTNIEILARAHSLVVVMPSAGRSFYANMANGQAYFSYITEELPALLAASFRISNSRENTFIAGISMGGYGAFKAAFLRPDLYAAACSLSGVLALNIFFAPPDKVENPALMHEFDMLFGGLEGLSGSMHDPTTWLKNAAASSTPLPRLFAACGLEDDLLPLNRLFVHAAAELGVPLHYQEEPGKHDWIFWQKQIEKFITTL